MPKHVHEIRDPIHTFVRLDSHEREVLDSRPFQRLRHIHQLALTYLVYPGATHRRFEHSLGVMELASRVFDVVTNRANVTEPIRDRLSELDRPDDLGYWRRVLRMAALCHDVGHLPFSHAAERDLLPPGWDHERMTREIICTGAMMEIWSGMTPPLRSEDIAKLAIGPKKAADLEFTDWEVILSEIIIGDAFGVDRMDYLLRDSHHTGVGYGRFDHYRLIDTLRILASPGFDDASDTGGPALGLESGGIQSAEALMFARYFMYSQVYFHPVRRIYDIHLMDFLKEWLDGGAFSTEVPAHLRMTDDQVTAGIQDAAMDADRAGHLHACRIVRREHFKVAYERNPGDVEVNPEAGRAVFESLGERFGPDNVRRDRYRQLGGAPDFPVRLRNEDVVSSLALSEVLNGVPLVSVDYVFVERARFDEAVQWLQANRADIVTPNGEAPGGETQTRGPAVAID